METTNVNKFSMLDDNVETTTKVETTDKVDIVDIVIPYQTKVIEEYDDKIYSRMSNSRHCGYCEEEQKGFCYLDRSASRDDVIFICYNCGSLMTNSQENLDYYNKLMSLLGIEEDNEIKKSIALENHFQNIYVSPKIEKSVKKFMFNSGRWV
jgi:hypothetical protein